MPSYRSCLEGCKDVGDNIKQAKNKTDDPISLHMKTFFVLFAQKTICSLSQATAGSSSWEKDIPAVTSQCLHQGKVFTLMKNYILYGFLF